MRRGSGAMTGVLGVVTTGIYCRPGCAARPKPENRREFATAAAAEAAGLRACFVCRPYRSDVTLSADAPELVCRAVRLVLDGWLDGRSERQLADRVGASERHLRQLFHEHVGVTPDRLARSARAHFARRLLDDSDLRIVDVVWAAGFGSVRQFNREMKQVFRATPRELRAKRRRADRLVADGGLPLRIGHGPQFDWDDALRTLAARAWPGVEHVAGRAYRRIVVIDGHPGVVELRPGGDHHLMMVAHLPRWDGLVHLVQRVRQMLQVDVVATSRDTDGIGLELVRQVGAWDPFEAGVRLLLGDHDDDRDLAHRLVRAHGSAVGGLTQLGLTHTFPTPDVLAAADLTEIGVPDRTARHVRELADMVAAGGIDRDRAATVAEVNELVAVVVGPDDPPGRQDRLPSVPLGTVE